MPITVSLDWSHQLSYLQRGAAAAAVRQRRVSAEFSCPPQLPLPPALEAIQLQPFAAAAAVPLFESQAGPLGSPPASPLVVWLGVQKV